jgi:hypothetical protein
VERGTPDREHPGFFRIFTDSALTSGAVDLTAEVYALVGGDVAELMRAARRILVELAAGQSQLLAELRVIWTSRHPSAGSGPRTTRSPWPAPVAGPTRQVRAGTSRRNHHNTDLGHGAESAPAGHGAVRRIRATGAAQLHARRVRARGETHMPRAARRVGAWCRGC